MQASDDPRPGLLFEFWSGRLLFPHSNRSELMSSKAIIAVKARSNKSTLVTGLAGDSAQRFVLCG